VAVSILVVMVAVVMIVTVITEIIIRPGVPYSDIYCRCGIPVAIVKRIITPVI